MKPRQGTRKTRRIAAGALLFILAALPSTAQNSFHDPHGRFSLRAPSNWTITPLNPDCVQLSLSPAYVTLFVFEGSDPNLFLNAIASQTARQWRAFMKIHSGPAPFAGTQASESTYTGLNPSHAKATLETLAARRGPWVFVLMISAPQNEFPRLKPQFDQIAQGVTPNVPPDATLASRQPPAPSPSAPSPSAPSSTPRPTPAPAAPAAPNAAAPTANYWKVRQASVIDASGFERPMRALSLFLPLDWTLQNNIQYSRAAGCPANLVHLGFRASSPDGALSLEMLPDGVWQWSADPNAVRMMQSSNTQMAQYGMQGCPVMPAMSAAQYLRRVVIPQARPGARLVSVEPMPDLVFQVQAKARQQEQLAASMGMRVRFQPDAARARIEYQRAGRDTEEWITAVTFTAAMPGPSLNPRAMSMGQAMYFSCQATYLFAAAPAGRLDALEHFYLLLISSVQLDPLWQARLTQVAARMNAENGAAAAERSQIIADAGRQISDMTNRGYQQRSRIQDSSAKQFDQYIRGVQSFRNPETGETVELSNEYGRAWANGQNEYILSDSATFNPNVALQSGSWTELEPVKP